MADYKKMYTTVFNAVTDAVQSIQRNDYDTAKEILIKAQQKAEEYYISDCTHKERENIVSAK